MLLRRVGRLEEDKPSGVRVVGWWGLGRYVDDRDECLTRGGVTQPKLERTRDGEESSRSEYCGLFHVFLLEFNVQRFPSSSLL